MLNEDKGYRVISVYNNMNLPKLFNVSMLQDEKRQIAFNGLYLRDRCFQNEGGFNGYFFGIHIYACKQFYCPSSAECDENENMLGLQKELLA